jgi:signal transduction histidine kinase
MRLQQRFLLALIVIAAVLVTPAVFGRAALKKLRDVTGVLQARDAVGALSLGRLQTAFGQLDSDERIYLALAGQPGPERERARARMTAEAQRVAAELNRLETSGYPTSVRSAYPAWNRLQNALAEEQRLIEAGLVEDADRFHTSTVDPAFAAVDRSLDPIGIAINQAGQGQVELAKEIARRAGTTLLLALSVALALALVLGGWLARSVLRPIHELRRGMGRVAEGDFEPDLRIPLDRPDELGDLGRSFRWMAEQLRELERLRAEFVSVASHELKTPLSVIKGYVSLLEDGIYGEVPEEQQKVLAAIGDQGDRLARLVQQLLDVSRFEAGGARLHIQPVALRSFLKDLAESFEPLAVQSEIDFRMEASPDLPDTVSVDPDRMNEVVGNLLSNAFKFTPRQGKIVLAAHRGMRQNDQAIVIEVTDTGVGIPPEKLPRVFEKFYQVENSAQPLSVGSGLGLAISKEIVEAHEGTITAESRVGRGTTFRVIIPTAQQPAA